MAAGAALFLATAAGAQTVEFRGGGYLSVPHNAACKAGGWPGREYYVNIRYRPAGLGSNPPQDRLSFFFPHFAMNYQVTGSLTKTFQPLSAGGGLGSGHYTYSTAVEIKKTSMKPRTVTVKSQSVVLSGRIKNLDDVTGCNGVFRGTLARTPG